MTVQAEDGAAPDRREASGQAQAKQPAPEARDPSREPCPAIEDYAIIGNCRTAALVARDGAIDWLCLPRFDSDACFARLLGEVENGRWRIAPDGVTHRVRRRYRDDTLILETEFETAEGCAAVIDFMPFPHDESEITVIRLVEGRHGRVPMRMEALFRFDYGRVVPWVRGRDDGIAAIAGPAGLRLRTPVALHGEAMSTVGTFTVAAGDRVPFALTWFPSHRPEPLALDCERELSETEGWWRKWASRCSHRGPHEGVVVRSLLTLKALTYEPTGGIIAAPTTSLPEEIGGVRNWDYRFCWIRDATLTLYALLVAGYTDEAQAWGEWLLRSAAGRPEQLQIMYGLAGERRLTELELDWLPGYRGSRPVRIGNGAHAQLQLDVYGGLMGAAHLARKHHLAASEDGWRVQKVLLGFLEEAWEGPDEGIWEIRGPRRHFVHSKVMAWVAFDRSIAAVEQFGLEGPVGRWRELRDRIHTEVCERGWSARRGSFVQSYESESLDAALLLIPQVGFLPPDDPRVIGTVRAIERNLAVDGLIRRYETASGVDGLPGGEGAFLACSFWLADALALIGEGDRATALFERLLTLCNDVGLLAEEYDPRARRMLGNFPQAFSHVCLVNTASNLALVRSPAEDRRSAGGAVRSDRRPTPP